MKVIAVTGTPGTGKTTLSKNLAKKFDFLYFDVNRLVIKNQIFEGYDKKRKTKIVDVKKLTKFLISEIKNLKNKKFFVSCERVSTMRTRSLACREKFFHGIIIDSHLSHYLPRKYVDLCIVTKCDIKELSKRLKRKKFHKSKIQENLQAEIFDICCNEAKEMKHKVFVINTTKDFNINTLYQKIKSLI